MIKNNLAVNLGFILAYSFRLDVVHVKQHSMMIGAESLLIKIFQTC